MHCETNPRVQKRAQATVEPVRWHLAGSKYITFKPAGMLQILATVLDTADVSKPTISEPIFVANIIHSRADRGSRASRIGGTHRVKRGKAANQDITWFHHFSYSSNKIPIALTSVPLRICRSVGQTVLRESRRENWDYNKVQYRKPKGKKETITPK